MEKHKDLLFIMFWFFLVIMFVWMKTAANIFSDNDIHKCNGTLVVPFDWGLKKSVCINFDDMKQHNIKYFYKKWYTNNIVELQCKYNKILNY